MHWRRPAPCGNIIIKYYQSVLTITEKHQKKLRHSYFWIRPIIRNLETNKVLVGFPWYDTLDEIKRLFFELNQEVQGNIFFDADQSWQLIIDNYCGQIFIKEFDPDENEIYCQISIDRQIMIEQIENDKMKVLFSEGVSAIAPGQAAVFYEGNDVIGGGWITQSFRENALQTT